MEFDDMPLALRASRFALRQRFEMAMNGPDDKGHEGRLIDRLREREIAVFDPKRHGRNLDRD